MKKIQFVLTLLLAAGLCHHIQAQSTAAGEQVFIENADKCLSIIEAAAQQIDIKGVAVIAYIPGDSTTSWISKAKVVGALTKDEYNLLAIAYSKASEMATTYKDSGSKVREKKIGELGWEGGTIRKVKSGYLVAAFSGGQSEQDVAVSKQGLDWLEKFY